MTSDERALLDQAAGDLAEIIEHHEDGDERHLERAIDEARATHGAIRRAQKAREEVSAPSEGRELTQEPAQA